MQKIVPHLWYDKEAKEAAEFYTSLFEQSGIIKVQAIKNPPPLSESELVSFELAGQEFMTISAGPYFKLNPSVSLMVACFSTEEIDALWQALSAGGTALMEIGEYPFSKRYGWIQDRFGLSWQLMLVDEGQAIQKITPNLLFSAAVCGKAEEAIHFYTDIFNHSHIAAISHYGAGDTAILKAKVNYASFTLDGLSLSAMDNAYDVGYSFNEAFSLIINCKDQAEIDYFWAKLSAVPESEQCGWLKDKYGLSWQVVPDNVDDLLFGGTEEEVRRVTEAFLEMKKIDIEAVMAIKKGLP